MWVFAQTVTYTSCKHMLYVLLGGVVPFSDSAGMLTFDKDLVKLLNITWIKSDTHTVSQLT